MDTITVAAAIIAITEQIKQNVPHVNGLVTLLVALIMGAAAGYFHVEGLTLATGIMAGLTAVGAHTALSAAGSAAGTNSTTNQ